jgi:ABC-type ATPase involved in cell division
MPLTLFQLPRPAVICDGVGYRYGEVPALNDVAFSLERGELAFLVGPSASGKTTLLRILHGQLRPSSGRLIVQGVDARRAGSGRRLRRQVGAVFHDCPLLERLTAVENVAYTLRARSLGLAPREAEERATTLLAEVGLGGRLGAYPRQLSGGQRQRLAIARAMAPGPGLLLADEPAAHLDAAGAGHVLGVLRQAARRGMAVLIATHDADSSAALGCRTLAIEGGRLRVGARPAEMLEVAR